MRFPNNSAPGSHKLNIRISRNKRQLDYQEHGGLTPLLCNTGNIDFHHQINNQLEINPEHLRGAWEHISVEPVRIKYSPNGQNHPESSLSICRKRRDSSIIRMLFMWWKFRLHSLVRYTPHLSNPLTLQHLQIDWEMGTNNTSFFIWRFTIFKLNKSDFKMWLNWFYQ